MQKVKKRGSAKARQKAARLIAAQALYQMYLNEDTPEKIIREFFDYRIGQRVDGRDLLTAEPEFLSALIQGVAREQENLISLIEGGLQAGKKQTVDQLELLMRCILLLGCFELVEHHHIDAPVIISEYVDVAKAYYEDDKANIVNAVLDKIKRTIGR